MSQITGSVIRVCAPSCDPPQGGEQGGTGSFLAALKRVAGPAVFLGPFAPEAAVLALGHAGANVTVKHYVAGPAIVARAFDRLDQPAAFIGTETEA